MFPIACYQATGQYFAHSALNDRFPAILNAQNPAIPSAHPHLSPNKCTRLLIYPIKAMNQQGRRKRKICQFAVIHIIQNAFYDIV